MNNYVVHLTPLKGMIASVRITQFISKTLKMPIISTPEECIDALWKGKVGTVIVVNGPPAFCKFRDEVAKLILDAKLWIWVQNDYTIYPPSQVSKEARKRGLIGDGVSYRNYRLWTATKTRELVRPGDTHINWNLITMYPPHPWGRRDFNFFYYGAFREGREERFKKFLPVGCHISAPKRAQERYRQLGPKKFFMFDPVDDVVEFMRNYRATVNIHDRRTDKHDEYPPNRFYEALSAGTAQFMNESMAERLESAGYPVRDTYVIEDHKELTAMSLKKLNYTAEKQNTDWANMALKHRRKLPSQVKEAYKRAVS